MRWVRLTPLIVVVGVLVVQAAWILAIIPFGGIDEPDQVFRAAAVARGEWRSTEAAEGGRGGLVSVPPDIVAAARTQCELLTYNRPVNCVGAGTTDDGLVRIASGASRYHPAFYWAVGTAARPFHGVAALYAMRITVALLCDLGLALVAWCLLRRAPGPWTAAALVVGLSPVLLYSTTVPAPNGPEMVGGLLLWGGLLALRTERGRGDGRAVAAATLGAVLLVTLRTLGPLFAVLIVLCVLVARRTELGDVVRAHRRSLLAGTGVSLVAGIASLGWIVTQQPLGTHDGNVMRYHLTDVLVVLPTGLLQSIAAAPSRNDPAPGAVYPLYLLLIVGLLLAGLRHSRGGARAALGLAVALSLVVPLAVTLLGLHSVGLIWQGRYALPFTAGVVVLAGVLAQRGGARLPRPGWWGLTGCWVVAQVLACAGAFAREQGLPGATPGWVETSTLTVAVVSALGSGLVGLAVVVSADRATERVPEQAPAQDPVPA